MAHGWAESRRTISLARHQIEGARQTYLRLHSEMDQIPTRYRTIIHEPQHTHTTSPSILSHLENSNPSFAEVIRALDEVLSELKVLEIKYMLQADSSNGPAMKIPFLLRLKFKIKGKRKLKAVLGEMQRHNAALKVMIKDLRKTIQCNLAVSVLRMNSMNIEFHPARCHINPLQADEGFSVLSAEDLIALSPSISHCAGDIASLQAAEGFLMLSTEDLIDLSPNISPDVGDSTAVLVDDPLQTPPLPTSDPMLSTASFRVNMLAGGVFESPASSISYEREDNYSIHKDKGDKICTQCHQMCRGASYS